MRRILFALAVFCALLISALTVGCSGGGGGSTALTPAGNDDNANEDHATTGRQTFRVVVVDWSDIGFSNYHNDNGICFALYGIEHAAWDDTLTSSIAVMNGVETAIDPDNDMIRTADVTIDVVPESCFDESGHAEFTPIVFDDKNGSGELDGGENPQYMTEDGESHLNTCKIVCDLTAGRYTWTVLTRITGGDHVVPLGGAELYAREYDSYNGDVVTPW